MLPSARPPMRLLIWTGTRADMNCAWASVTFSFPFFEQPASVDLNKRIRDEIDHVGDDARHRDGRAAEHVLAERLKNPGIRRETDIIWHRSRPHPWYDGDRRAA